MFTEYSVNVALFFLILKKEENVMKNTGNGYATNKGGVIKAPKPVTRDDPKATVHKGGDLRGGKNN